MEETTSWRGDGVCSLGMMEYNIVFVVVNSQVFVFKLVNRDDISMSNYSSQPELQVDCSHSGNILTLYLKAYEVSTCTYINQSIHTYHTYIHSLEYCGAGRSGPQYLSAAIQSGLANGSRQRPQLELHAVQAYTYTLHTYIHTYIHT